MTLPDMVVESRAWAREVEHTEGRPRIRNAVYIKRRVQAIVVVNIQR